MSEPESNRQRRLREAVEDLPESFPSTRDRTPSEQLSRHLDALRARLDWLVDLEDRYGEEQSGVHRNRAERNALIFALQHFAATALDSAAQPVKAADRQLPRPDYVNSIIEAVADLEGLGFTRADRRRPGVALHRTGDDIAPIEVPVRV